jgi:hypothetical protein
MRQVSASRPTLVRERERHAPVCAAAALIMRHAGVGVRSAFRKAAEQRRTFMVTRRIGFGLPAPRRTRKNGGRHNHMLCDFPWRVVILAVEKRLDSLAHCSGTWQTFTGNSIDASKIDAASRDGGEALLSNKHTADRAFGPSR